MQVLAPKNEMIDYRKVDGEWYCFGEKLSEVNKNEPPEYLANLVQALEAIETGSASQTLVVSDKYGLVNNFIKAPDGRILNEAFSGSKEILTQLSLDNAQAQLTNGVLSVSNYNIPQQAIEQLASRQGLLVEFYSTAFPSDASLPTINRSQEVPTEQASFYNNTNNTPGATPETNPALKNVTEITAPKEVEPKVEVTWLVGKTEKTFYSEEKIIAEQTSAREENFNLPRVSSRTNDTREKQMLNSSDPSFTQPVSTPNITIPTPTNPSLATEPLSYSRPASLVPEVTFETSSRNPTPEIITKTQAEQSIQNEIPTLRSPIPVQEKQDIFVNPIPSNTTTDDTRAREQSNAVRSAETTKVSFVPPSTQLSDSDPLSFLSEAESRETKVNLSNRENQTKEERIIGRDYSGSTPRIGTIEIKEPEGTERKNPSEGIPSILAVTSEAENVIPKVQTTSAITKEAEEPDFGQTKKRSLSFDQTSPASFAEFDQLRADINPVLSKDSAEIKITTLKDAVTPEVKQDLENLNRDKNNSINTDLPDNSPAAESSKESQKPEIDSSQRLSVEGGGLGRNAEATTPSDRNKDFTEIVTTQLESNPTEQVKTTTIPEPPTPSAESSHPSHSDNSARSIESEIVNGERPPLHSEIESTLEFVGDPKKPILDPKTNSVELVAVIEDLGKQEIQNSDRPSTSEFLDLNTLQPETTSPTAVEPSTDLLAANVTLDKKLDTESSLQPQDVLPDNKIVSRPIDQELQYVPSSQGLDSENQAEQSSRIIPPVNSLTTENTTEERTVELKGKIPEEGSDSSVQRPAPLTTAETEIHSSSNEELSQLQMPSENNTRGEDLDLQNILSKQKSTEIYQDEILRQSPDQKTESGEAESKNILVPTETIILNSVTPLEAEPPRDPNLKRLDNTDKENLPKSNSEQIALNDNQEKPALIFNETSHVAEDTSKAVPENIIVLNNIDSSQVSPPALNQQSIEVDIELTALNLALSKIIDVTEQDPASLSKEELNIRQTDLAPEVLQLIKMIASDQSTEARELIEILATQFLNQSESLELRSIIEQEELLLKIIENSPKELFLEGITLIKEYFIQQFAEIEPEIGKQSSLGADLRGEIDTTPLEVSQELETRKSPDSQTVSEYSSEVPQLNTSADLESEKQFALKLMDLDTQEIPRSREELILLEEQLLQKLLSLKSDPELAKLLALEIIPINLSELTNHDLSQALAVRIEELKLVLNELQVIVEIAKLLNNLPLDQVITLETYATKQQSIPSKEIIELLGNLQSLKQFLNENQEVLLTKEKLLGQADPLLPNTIEEAINSQIKALQDLLMNESQAEDLLTPKELTEYRLKRIYKLNLLRVLTTQETWSEDQLELFMQIMQQLQVLDEATKEDQELNQLNSSESPIDFRVKSKSTAYFGKKLALKASRKSKNKSKAFSKKRELQFN